MIASYSEYLKKKAVLASGGDFSADAVAKVQAALKEYEDEFLDGGDGSDLPLTPDENTALAHQDAGLPSQEEIAHSGPTTEDRAAKLVSMLDPMSPLQPQALATSPVTTHPKGDDAAKDEWVRGDLDNPAGRVIVYDAPLAVVRKKLGENPQLLESMGMSVAPGARIEKGDSYEQAYQDWNWRQTADAAAKAGKTAYRHSRAPWLGDGKSASLLSTLSTKVKSSALPAIGGATAFVMGVDDTASFGAATAASNAGLLDTDEPAKPADGRKGVVPGSVLSSGNDELVGGLASPEVNAAPTREANDILKEENPGLYTGGQVAGALSPEAVAKGVGAAVGAVKKTAGEAVERGIKELGDWSVSNSLWDAVMGVWTPKSAVGAAAASVGKAGVAAGATRAVNEAVTAGANYAGTRDTGTTLGEAGGRIKDAATTGAAFTVPFAGASALGDWVRTGARYEGLPGKVEKLNEGKVYPLVGHATPKVVSEAAREGGARSIGVGPVDVLAEKLETPLKTAAKEHEAGVRKSIGQENAAVHASAEGKQKLPAQKTAETALTELRERTARIGSDAPTPVGVPNADRPVKGIFNSNIEGISITPKKGWLPMSVPEAEAYLNPVWRKRALRASAGGKQPVMRPGANLAKTAEGGAMTGKAASTAIEKTSEGGAELAREERSLARVGGYRGARHPELPAAGAIEKAAPAEMVRGSRAATAAEKAGAPKVTAREVGPQGSRWKRRGEAGRTTPAEPATAKGKAWKKAIAPGTFRQEMARRGVKTVYVAPRKYDSLHHESAIRQLRRKGADTANDRDLKKIYHAALQDRDARPLKGEPGGWSKLQRQHETQIRAAKDTSKRAAPDTGEGAYGAVVKSASERTGESKDLRALEDTAARAGGNALQQLRGARVIEPLEKLKSLGGFGKESRKGLFGLSALGDAMMLRGIYPLTRAVEKVGPKVARVGELGEHHGEAERRKARDEANRPKAAAPDKRKHTRRPRRKVKRQHQETEE